MTMPSIDHTPYPPPNGKNPGIDRLRQRYETLRHRHSKSLNQFNMSQNTLRANEKRDTQLLRQRLQETKMKKGPKCKPDVNRSKITTLGDDGDAGYAILRQPPKRKLPDCDNLGYADAHGQQQDPKRKKNESQPMNNNADYSQLSVQIVAKYGNGAPSDQIKVNFQSNRNGSDKDSVSVKVEQDNSRRGQQQTQTHMNQHPNMHQDARHPVPEMNNGNSFPGNLSESEALSREFDDIMEYMDELTQEQAAPTMRPPQHPQPRMTPPSYQAHMTTSQNFSTLQQNQQYLVTSQSQHPPQQRPMMYSHMPSSGQSMTSPMTSPMMQPQPNPVRPLKTEKADMYHMFRRTPENKPENPGMQRQNSHGIPHAMSGSIMSQQAVQFTGNNFSANISSQQNISMNMMPQSQTNHPPTMTRQMPSSNNNMTSQHIHRLSQVAHFSAHDTPQHEPPRLFHPPAQNPYESSSAQLRHIAEKNRCERNRPMTIPADPRTTPTLPHYHSEAPTMSQPMNMVNHPISTGSQRLSHMDANMYRSQYLQNQQRPGMMMQQSMHHQENIMMRQYPMQQSQPPTYNRVPEPLPQQQVVPANQPSYHGNGHPQQWNSARWQQVTSHNPVHHHRPQVTPDAMQQPHMNSTVSSSNYIPELDNNDLNFIDEIFNEGGA